MSGQWDLLVGPTGMSSALERKNGDSVFPFYDDYFAFVIILWVKALSLITNDETVPIRHGMLTYYDENIIVTR